MAVGVVLILLVPAIVVVSVLYAIAAEMRHNRVRRSRWDSRETALRNDGPVLERAGHGD
jgi:Tfp pilus assembly protein PilE